MGSRVPRGVSMEECVRFESMRWTTYVLLEATLAFQRLTLASGAGLRRTGVKALSMSAIPAVPFDGAKVDGVSGPTLPGSGDLDFLEAKPYWDQSGVPVNVAKAKDPLIGKIVSCQRMVGPNAPGETCNIIIDHQGKLPYWEGQSYGILPPGIDPKKNKPYGVRLYSIASTRYGPRSPHSNCTATARQPGNCGLLLRLALTCPHLQVTTRPARPPPSASAAPPTGARSSRPTTPRRRASAPTTSATPSPVMRSRSPARLVRPRLLRARLSLSLSLSLSPPPSLAVGSGSGLELLLLKVGS